MPLIRRGCYRCLEEAHALATAQNQSQLAFEAASLLVLRSKELGIPQGRWRARAADLAAADAARAPILEMIDAVPPDPMSGDRDALFTTRLRVRSQLSPWRETLAVGAGSKEFRTYVDLALVCDLATGEQRDALLKSLQPPAESATGARLEPLLEYRVAICSFPEAERLRPLAAAGFVDVELALGRFALEFAKDNEQALRHLQTAAAEFPESLSAPTLIGNIHLEWEDWQQAVDAFDGVLARRPAHPEALIGRTQGVSRLRRFQDGLDTAARLIEAGNWYVGQARYWRAWNHYAMKDHPAARREADDAKKLIANADMFVLSGLIDWGLELRPSADSEFVEAFKLNAGHCEAVFYMGAVRAEMRKAPEGIAAMKQAIQCYDLGIRFRRIAIETIKAREGSEAGKARQIASQERAIAANEERKVQAARLIGQLEAYVTSLQAPPSTPAPSPSRPVQR